MVKGFFNIRYHIGDDRTRAGFMVRGAGSPAPAPRPEGGSDEAAARSYFKGAFAKKDAIGVRSAGTPADAESAPEIRLVQTMDSLPTKTRLLRFVQTQHEVPVFGTNVIVELGEKRRLISMDADLAQVGRAEPAPGINPEQALASIHKLTEGASGSWKPAQAPRLYYFRHNDDWHLAYFFEKVPAAPPDFLRQSGERSSHGHGRGLSPRALHPLLNYLVDAHNGEVLFYYSAAAMGKAGALEVPVKSQGVDENGAGRSFFCQEDPGKGFLLLDTLRNIRTYDMEFGDIMKAKTPGKMPCNKTPDWEDKSKAAVSAHANATKVYDFYKKILQRDGIDNNGMPLVSNVNCTYGEDGGGKEWGNAVWYGDQMLYGQTIDKDGTPHSFARYLDVIGHELTHGVTEKTANLVYHGQSGALNESFSDIFGVMINNSDESRPDADVSGWNWEIGPGLAGKGMPLRDLSDPKRTGDPDNMTDFLHTVSDNGGVHTNSNIHNKAAYNVLTAKDAAGKYAIAWKETALLYYLTLTRLGSLADFSKVLQALLDTARTYYLGDTGKDAKLEAISKAYADVGIR